MKKLVTHTQHQRPIFPPLSYSFSGTGDHESFVEGVQRMLRRTPQIITVSETRDPLTIAAAISAFKA